MIHTRKLFSLLLFLWALSNCLAQDNPDQLYLRLHTKDGNIYIGTVISQDTEIIKLQTQVGIIHVKTSDIKRIDMVTQREIESGLNVFASEHAQTTRYYWAPTGFGLKKGEGYYQNVWVMFNQVSVGLTDKITTGVGLVPLFLFAGAPSPAYLTMKFSVPVAEKFNLGIGGLGGTVIGEPETSFGLFFGQATFGSRTNNVSFGLGYGLGPDAGAPILSMSGMFKLSDRWYAMTENYLIRGEFEQIGILSFGTRRVTPKTGLDSGLFIPVGTGIFIAIPWLGITVPFGGDK